MKVSNKFYDQLNFLAKVVLPALATLYFALSQIWGFPKGEEVMGTITAVDVFLGALLVKLANNYAKNNEPAAGYLTQRGTDEFDRPVLGLTVTKEPADLLSNETVTFEVTDPPTLPPHEV